MKFRLDSAESNGNITLFVINLQNKKHVSLSLTDDLAHNTIYQYLLQPYGREDITAKYVKFGLHLYYQLNVLRNVLALTWQEHGNICCEIGAIRFRQVYLQPKIPSWRLLSTSVPSDLAVTTCVQN